MLRFPLLRKAVSRYLQLDYQYFVKENPTKYKELFKVFEILLIDGIIDTKFVNNWADKILSKESQSEFEFIELSLTNNINDLLSLLKKLSAKCDLKIVQRATFGILYNSTSNEFPDLKTTTRIVSRFVYKNALTEKEKEFLYGIDDYIELAISGIYGDLHKLKNEFWDFLEIYDSLNFVTYENWKALNKEIEDNIVISLEKVKKKHYNN